jgi:3-oxoacyl-[acyl-carrier protein] reductase
MAGRLAGKKALVTGGSRGIGLAIAIEYARQGADVGLLSRSREDLEVAASRVRHAAPDVRVAVTAADVSDLPAVEAAVARTAEALGGVDVVVNAAGIASLGDIDEMPPDQWRRQIEVNLMGSYHVARAVWPYLKKQGGGSIIMVSSGSGRRAHAGWSAYCASKFGVMGLVNALCKEGRPYGIRCNVICPGPTDTDQRASNFPGEDKSRLLLPEDIAEAAVFFGSDESRWVSGPGIDVRREPI